MTISIDVQLDGVLADHALAVTGEFGMYPDVAEYVRNLIRRDIDEVEVRLSEAQLAELREAFATPMDQYVTVSLEDVLARNGLSRAA